MLEYSRRNCRCSEGSSRNTSIGPLPGSLTKHLRPMRRPGKSFRQRACDKECNRRKQRNRTLRERPKRIRNVRETDIRPAPDIRKNAVSENSGELRKSRSSRSCRKCSRGGQDKPPAQDSWEQMTPCDGCAASPHGHFRMRKNTGRPGVKTD